MATEGKKDDDYDAELGGRFDTLMVRCLPRHASAAPALMCTFFAAGPRGSEDL